MKLENQVTSLEPSRKLDELGVKRESIWKHHWSNDRPEVVYIQEMKEVKEECKERYTCIPAYTVAELGEMLPKVIYNAYRFHSAEKDSAWCVYYSNYVHSNFYLVTASTEADARAKMLIYLIEQGLVKVEDLNTERGI